MLAAAAAMQALQWLLQQAWTAPIGLCVTSHKCMSPPSEHECRKREKVLWSWHQSFLCVLLMVDLCEGFPADADPTKASV